MLSRKKAHRHDSGERLETGSNWQRSPDGMRAGSVALKQPIRQASVPLKLSASRNVRL
jgi:hypothetical protein